MKLHSTYLVPAQRDKVFASLTDLSGLQSCITGCEKIEKISEDNYEAHMNIGIAGMKGRCIGKVRLRDKKPPEFVGLIMEGENKFGSVKGDADILLSEKGAHTEVSCKLEARVGGIIASLGSRLTEGIAKQVMDEFFVKFSEKLKLETPLN